MRSKVLVVLMLVACLYAPAGMGEGRTNPLSLKLDNDRDIPRQINYQGVLQNFGGTSLPDTTVLRMTFTIWDDSSGFGNQLWSEYQDSVLVINGLFNVLLGSEEPIPDSAFDDTLCWLETTVEGEPLKPMREIVSVGYAFRARIADTARTATIAKRAIYADTTFCFYVIGEDTFDLSYFDDRYVNEGQENSITTEMIEGAAVTNDKIEDNAITFMKIRKGHVRSREIGDYTIVDEDISPDAEINPTKIRGTAWTKENDGLGSGLDADLWNGYNWGDLYPVAETANIWASHVWGDLYPNADKLDNKHASDFALVNHQHDARYYTKSQLNTSDGTPPNTGSNRVNWHNLTDVPSGFADGVDDVGTGGGGISRINAGTGISVTNPTGPTTTVALTSSYAGGSVYDGRFVNEGQANSITGGMIQDGQVTNTDLANNAVSTAKIQDNAVTVGKIADNAVTSAKIQNGTITATDVGPNIVSSIDGVSNDGGNIDLVAGTNITITPNDAANTITIACTTGGGGGISQINAGTGISVTNPTGPTTTVALTSSYAGGSVYDGRFVNEGQANSITSAMITDGQVGSSDLANNAVTSAKIKDGTITTADIGPNIVSSIDGVSNDGGNIDLVAGANVTITPNDAANTITISCSLGTGDITAVYADNGLTGGATSGDAHLNVGEGTGISVSADAVALDVSYTDGRYVKEGQSNSITSGMITDGQIVNADISATAAISASKINDGAGSGLDADMLDGHHYSSNWEPDGYNPDNQPGATTRGEPTRNEIETWGADGYQGPRQAPTSTGRGEPTWNELDNKYFYWGLSRSNSGLGLRLSSNSENAIWGITSASGRGGVIGQTSGSSSYGIYGEYTGSGSGGIAVYGSGGYGTGVEGRSTHYYGVVGIVTSAYPAVYGRYDNNDAAGALGYAAHGGTGVYGDKGSGAYAGWFDGPVNSTGSLSSGSGSFLIDHPLDPENKVLKHSFVESPEMTLIYKGRANLKNGEVTVKLPDYFDVLNHPEGREITLTCVNGWSPLYLDGEIKGNQFTVKTTPEGNSDQEFSWVIYGVRNDAYARAYPIVVEQEKENGNTFTKGEYIHPDALSGGE